MTFFFFDFFDMRNFLYRFSFGSFFDDGGGGEDSSSPADGDVPSPGQIPSANVTDFLMSLLIIEPAPSSPAFIFSLLQQKYVV